MLRTFENNLLLGIDAKPEVRYGRCVIRGEKGEGKITFDEFLANENRETEKNIREVMKKTDYTINNNGTREELIKRLEEILEEKGM
jgi:dephospho-CoA kinase